MSSAAQVLANRQNSLHSTGPVTPEGKAASSRNALRHGLTSKHIVLPGEDADAYDAIRESFIGTLAPANEIERALVEEIAASNWRLMRVRRQETHILAQLAADSPNVDAALAAVFLEKPKEIARLTRYITSFENAFYRAMNKLEKLQKERRAAEEQVAIEAAALETMAQQSRQPAIGFVSQNPKSIPASIPSQPMPPAASRMNGDVVAAASALE